MNDLSRWLQLSQCIIYSLLFKKGYYCYHYHFWALFWLQLYLSVSMVLIYKSHSAFTLWLKGCCPLVLFVCTDVSSDYLLFVSNLCSYWHVSVNSVHTWQWAHLCQFFLSINMNIRHIVQNLWKSHLLYHFYNEHYAMTRSLSILSAFHSSFKTSDDALPSGRRINLQGRVINEVVEGRHMNVMLHECSDLVLKVAQFYSFVD